VLRGSALAEEGWNAVKDAEVDETFFFAVLRFFCLFL